MVYKAVKLVGGVESIIEPGDRVLVKPNLVTSVPEEITDPRVIKAVILLVEKANPGEVILGEGSLAGVDTEDVFSETGVRRIAEEMGVKLVDLKKAELVEVDVPGGEIFKKIRVPRIVIECDVAVNVPVLKTHVHTLLTLGLKNMKGVFPERERRIMHFTDINKGIADYVTVVKPDLTIVDAIVGLEGLGPHSDTGRPREIDMIVAGKDVVAVDAVCAKIVGVDPEEVLHIKYAARRGLGEIDLGRMEIRGERIEDVAIKDFEIPPPSLGALSPLPNVKIVDGSPCSACVWILPKVFKLLESDLKKIEKLTILVGPKARPPAEGEEGLIFVGNCLKGFGKEEGYVRGCPPFTGDVVERVRRLLVSHDESATR
ncbi:TPA: DUF362 domain-containing protein [Candidatus Bathyarchaeota archaeon]|nr:DUF362 domain-containing protein [Candidatus Bathyarchaeota archaeon]